MPSRTNQNPSLMRLGLRIATGLTIAWGFVVFAISTGTPYVSDYALRYVTQDEIDRMVDPTALLLLIFFALEALSLLSEIAAMNRIRAIAKASTNVDKFRGNHARDDIAPGYMDATQIPVDTDVDKSNAMKAARDNDEDSLDATRDEYPRA